jgi:hypothetical protein
VCIWDIQQRLRVVLRKPVTVAGVEQLIVAVLWPLKQPLQNLVNAKRVKYSRGGRAVRRVQMLTRQQH